MVRLKSPTGSGVGYGGQWYEADEKGAVTVPDSAEYELTQMHGFVHATDEAPVSSEDETVGEYTVKHQGRGKFMVIKDGEPVVSGLTKEEATAKVEELTNPE